MVVVVLVVTAHPGTVLRVTGVTAVVGVALEQLVARPLVIQLGSTLTLLVVAVGQVALLCMATRTLLGPPQGLGTGVLADD
jgi:hypothetical protein